MPLGISNLASRYATARRSKPGVPSMNRDPKAPGVRAGVGPKPAPGLKAPKPGKAQAFVGGKGPRKPFAAAAGMRS